MKAREVSCRVIEKIWLTPTVVRIRFAPSRAFRFEEGQFISLYVPVAGSSRPLRRIYSLASASDGREYELCVKVLPGGPGSTYLARLPVGAEFKATAPYGDFAFRPVPGRKACFIATGTGIAPFRAMARSRAFAGEQPECALLFGARDESEILYRGELEALGVEVVQALSRPSDAWNGFRGRVTDYLRSLPADWPWAATDFYLCGNGEMVREARSILVHARGVSEAAIHQEAYFSTSVARVSRAFGIEAA